MKMRNFIAIKSLVNKNAINAKCLTTHTFCSNSAYDHEAILSQIKPCDSSSIVKTQDIENHLIYDTYIRHLSDDHEKLFNVLSDDVAHPNFYPQRVFPNGPPKNKKYFSVQIIAYFMIVVILFVVILFAMYKIIRLKQHKKVINKATDNEYEYQPFINHNSIYGAT
eukprot:UN05955